MLPMANFTAVTFGGICKNLFPCAQSNKKTFLLIHALECGNPSQQKSLKKLLNEDSDTKVEQVISIFKDCKVDKWAEELKEQYFNEAMKHLEATLVVSNRKQSLKDLAKFLLMRDH